MYKNIRAILDNTTNEKNDEKYLKIFKKVKEGNRFIFHENMWYVIATLLHGVQIILMIALGASLMAMIVGSISSSIFIMILSRWFYRKYISKVDKEEDKVMLAENLKMLQDPCYNILIFCYYEVK